MKRALLALFLGLLAMLILTACAGLPSSSPVREGKPVTARVDADPLDVMPDGPLPGDSAQQIATGFLRAQAWSPSNYAVARSFLTRSAQRQWHPGTTISIFDDNAGFSVTRPSIGAVRVRVNAVGSLSPDGHFERFAAPQSRVLDFTATGVSGSWRLASVPKNLGLWLSQDDFARLYKPADVYYPSAYGHVMVPDPRWFPRQGFTTALARAALTSPPPWLAPSIRDPFPRGTALDVESVPVAGNGNAAVDLSAAAQSGSSTARSAMWAALVATVVQAPDVQSVSVSSRGSQLEAANVPAAVTSLSDLSDLGYSISTPSPSAVISRSGTLLSWTNPDALSAADGTTKALASGRPRLPSVPSSWRFLAAGPGGRQIAAISHDGTSVRRWVNGTSLTVAALGTDLVRPSFDNFGFLWCAGDGFADQPDSDSAPAAQGPASVWALDTSKDGGTPAPSALHIPWLGSSHVIAMSVSPEGQRLALVLSDHNQRRVVVAAVMRGATGIPTGLGAPYTVAQLNATDVVWADASNLGLLVPKGGTQQVMEVSFDGTMTSLGSLGGAAELSSTDSGSSGLFVETASRSVYSRLGSSWSSFLTGGDLVAPPS